MSANDQPTGSHCSYCDKPAHETRTSPAGNQYGVCFACAQDWQAVMVRKEDVPQIAAISRRLYRQAAEAAGYAVTDTTEPSDLDVAISVARQLLGSDSVLSLRESLRLLLRALDAEPDVSAMADTQPRCPAAHPDDPTPCGGPVVVTVLDSTNAGANGCEHHGARLLASLDGGRVYGLPDAPESAALRVFHAADRTRPFPWMNVLRTRPEQLSRAENRARGERP